MATSGRCLLNPREDVSRVDMKVSVRRRDEDEQESSFIWPEHGKALGNEEQIP